MKPTSHQPTPDYKHELSAQAIYDIRAPLTVIKGQAQLVQRWIGRNDVPGAEVLLARMAVIDDMVCRLDAHLDEQRAPEQTSVAKEPIENSSNVRG
jgi:nitrogen-specific signal transduction histidine kinase